MATPSSVKNLVDEKVNDITMSEAIAQFKEATSSIYDAVGLIGSASVASAKTRLHEGKDRAVELEAKAEDMIRARPLVTIGVAFAAGWLVSRLMQSRG